MRFVILHHDWPQPHFDLMLESDGVLKTWRLAAVPTVLPVAAEAIGDHRLAYLDYEGPIRGGRGTVTRWDAGELTWLPASNNEYHFSLTGHHMRGSYYLKTINGVWQLQPARNE